MIYDEKQKVIVTMNVKEKNIEYGDVDKYEYVPPEGGWGYAVCVGLSVIFVSIFFFFLFKDYWNFRSGFYFGFFIIF